MNLAALHKACEQRGISFDRERWRRTLTRCEPDELATALDAIPPEVELNPAAVNAAIRMLRHGIQAEADRHAADRARAQARAEWDRYMGRVS